MAIKKILVSDITGKELKNPVKVTFVGEADRWEMDADHLELTELLKAARPVKKRGRPKQS